ncbi:serine hydrolase domain-containing protein [Virgisporangium aurantiacum]|uniref:Beta-lactamase-related domain-containing protein n=1 Tax=Virgisporangium aurantiacum TaxID=175570 RepID=A0A8J4E4S1_9ACTN|nr:serine hydrolase domain-containing protein [Virgisporangium aurantiacum]GIJ62245.1 hypothetical protein Vau01_097610 [Virgisporangium aurantiacum]
MIDILDRVTARCQRAVDDGGYLGIQVYAALDGRPMVDLAVGHRDPVRPLTADDPLPWVCGAKAFGSIAVGQLVDQGLLDPWTAVADVVPEYAAGGKAGVTVAQLMSHSVPIADPSPTLPLMSDDEALAEVCRTPLTAPAGTRARYSGFASWVVVAELVRRLSGRTYEDYVEEQILDPLRLDRTVFGRRRADRQGGPPFGVLYEVVDGHFVPSSRLAPSAMAPHLPGTGAHGTAAELARVYGCVATGRWGERRLLSAEAVTAIARPYRAGLPDPTFGGLDLRWGLGVCIDGVLFGAPPTACVVGQIGYNCSLVLADLTVGLVVAFLTSSVYAGTGRDRVEKRLVRDLYDMAAAER